MMLKVLFNIRSAIFLISFSFIISLTSAASVDCALLDTLLVEAN